MPKYNDFDLDLQSTNNLKASSLGVNTLNKCESFRQFCYSECILQCPPPRTDSNVC